MSVVLSRENNRLDVQQIGVPPSTSVCIVLSKQVHGSYKFTATNIFDKRIFLVEGYQILRWISTNIKQYPLPNCIPYNMNWYLEEHFSNDPGFLIFYAGPESFDDKAFRVINRICKACGMKK